MYYLVRGEITTLKIDCLVNTISDTKNVIFRLGGSDFTKKYIKPPTGTANIIVLDKIGLQCKYVIHTTGPQKHPVNKTENYDILAQCYSKCLQLATDYKLKEIAFPNISPEYDSYKSCKTAVDTVKNWMRDNFTTIEKVYFVATNDDDEFYLSRMM